MDEKIAFGQRLLELRKKAGKSQAEIAQLLGITTAAYQNYENGRREAGYATITKLATFFGVSTDCLLGREPVSDPLPLLVAQTNVSKEELGKQFDALPNEGKAIMMTVIRMLKKSREQNNKE